MRILILALLFSVFSYGQNITTVHFNYKWNDNNTYRGLDRLRNTKVQYAFVEDQSDAIKKSIKSVPTIIVFDEGIEVVRFEANIMMQLEATKKDIQAEIDKIMLEKFE